MFWKGRKNKAKEEGESCGFDVTFDLDRRQYFRISPAPGKPITLALRGERYDVYDISAGGFAFMAKTRLAAGSQEAAVLQLPPPAKPLALKFEVIEQTKEGSVRARITKIKDLDQEQIHFYVLTRQKEELENKRSSNQDNKQQ